MTLVSIRMMGVMGRAPNEIAPATMCPLSPGLSHTNKPPYRVREEKGGQAPSLAPNTHHCEHLLTGGSGANGHVTPCPQPPHTYTNWMWMKDDADERDSGGNAMQMMWRANLHKEGCEITTL